MIMKTLSIIMLFVVTTTYSQYKKVESFTSEIGTVFTIGQKFTVGEHSGDNNIYLYIHSRPNALAPTIYHMQAGFYGREYEVHTLLVEKRNPERGYILFKLGLVKYMVQIDNAQRSGEIIL